MERVRTPRACVPAVRRDGNAHDRNDRYSSSDVSVSLGQPV